MLNNRMFRSFVLFYSVCCDAFGVVSRILPSVRRAVGLDCICINRGIVDRCRAYHVVESKHGQPHLTEQPDFVPRVGSTTIAINIFQNTSEIELDVTDCDDFVEEPGRWVKMMPKGTLIKLLRISVISIGLSR